MNLSERIAKRQALEPNENGRIGSHAQPCKLTWCQRPECKRDAQPKQARWLRNPERFGKVLA